MADLDIAEGAVTVVGGDGETITFSESQFTAAKQGSLGADGSVRWVIEGNYPSPGGNYIVDINVVGSTAASAATAGSFEFGDLVNNFNSAASRGFPAYGGSFPIEVTANGRWIITTTSGNAEPRVMPNTGSESGLSEITLDTLGPGIAQGGFTLQLRSTNGTILDTYPLNYGTQYGAPKVEISSSAPAPGTNDQIITFVTS